MQHETFWLIFILSWQLTCRQTSVACIKGKPYFQSKNAPHEFTNIVKKHNTFCNFVVCWSSLLCSLWQRRWDYFKRTGAMNIVINVMKIFSYTLDEIEWFVVLWSLRIYFKMCVCSISIVAMSLWWRLAFRSSSKSKARSSHSQLLLSELPSCCVIIFLFFVVTG